MLATSRLIRYRDVQGEHTKVSSCGAGKGLHRKRTYIHSVMGVIREPCEATPRAVSLVPHRLATAAARLGISLACNRPAPVERQSGGGGGGVYSCLGSQATRRQ